MTMTGLRYYFFIIALFALVACLAGCSGSTDAPSAGDEPAAEAWLVKPEPVIRATAAEEPSSYYSLVSKDGIKVGTCAVSNDGDYLYFHYETYYEHPMNGVRIFAGDAPPTGDETYYTNNIQTTPSGFTAVASEPRDEGTLDAPAGDISILPEGVLPLPYELSGLGNVSSVDLVFIMPDDSPGATIYVQADASINAGFGSGFTADVEDPAAPGETIIEYDIVPFLSLPTVEVNVMLNYGYYTDSTYTTTLRNVPQGFDVVPNQPYVGWCVDIGTPIYMGYLYSTMLYNSLDSDLPAQLQDNDWDMVNYVLNHTQGHYGPVQSAIWYFVGGGDYPTNPEARSMVDEALENGEGFTPGPNDKVAVIVDVGDAQTTIIEVDIQD